MNVVGAGFRGNHDDGQLRVPSAFPHDFQHLEAIHFRHHVVKQNEREFESVIVHEPDRLFAVSRFDQVVFVFEHIR